MKKKFSLLGRDMKLPSPPNRLLPRVLRVPHCQPSQTLALLVPHILLVSQGGGGGGDFWGFEILTPGFFGSKICQVFFWVA